jgi:hypothetical protein
LLLPHSGGSSSTEVVAAAAATLAALALGDPRMGAVAQEAGGVAALLRLLDSPELLVHRSAAAALCSLAGVDSCRRIILEGGGVAALVRLLGCSGPLAQQGAAGAVSKLAAGSDASRAAVGKAAGAIPALVRLLGSASPGVQLEAAGALNSLAGLQPCAQLVEEAGGSGALQQLLDSGTSSQGAREQAGQALANVRAARSALKSVAQLVDRASGLMDALERAQKVGGWLLRCAGCCCSLLLWRLGSLSAAAVLLCTAS